MPAVTVADRLVLPRISVLDPQTTVLREVRQRTTAPSGLEGEGFPVRRAFAGIADAALDPFIHMDQMGEVEYGPGEPKGTPWHPHRGFETVTYMIDGVFVHRDSIGGGGLISGIAAYVKQLRPEIRIIGVQTFDSDAMFKSVQAGRRITLSDVGLFSDGTAVKQVGVETFRLAREYVDDYVLVDTDSICAAIKDVFQDTRSVLEPAGALALAGAKQYALDHKLKGNTLIAIACGANMNFDRLRFVAERADVGEDREAVFAVTLPEERGSFRAFCELVGNRNVTEFNYRISDSRLAHVFVGIQVSNSGEPDRIAANFRKHGFDTIDLTHNEMAKTHLRHMVGGRSALARDELLYRFEFPERPGALMRFLNSMKPDWNISLFHYRNQGADYGQVLIGMQVPAGNKKAFRDFLAEVGYQHWNETKNPAYRLFL